MNDLCPTCGGGIWPGRQTTQCPNAFHRQGKPLEAKIFVFGSNLSGIHGAGAAKFALQNHGAIWGQGFGPQGNSYAIPTKDEGIVTLPIWRIAPFVKEFMIYAQQHPELKFQVTRIGCGLAGYTDKDIAPLFKEAPLNCALPEGW